MNGMTILKESVGMKIIGSDDHPQKHAVRKSFAPALLSQGIVGKHFADEASLSKEFGG